MPFFDGSDCISAEKYPDLARGAVVDRRAVKDRDHRIGALDRRPVLRAKIHAAVTSTSPEFVLVRDEDVEGIGTRGGALVDEERSYGVKSGLAK